MGILLGIFTLLTGVGVFIAGMNMMGDGLKKKLSSQHFTRLATGACKVEQSAYFFSTVAGLERVADHLINIGYSILTPTGDQKYSKIKA